MSNTFATFTTSQAAIGRVARAARFVTIVETAKGFFELDADDQFHASILGFNWTRPELGGMAASCWRVMSDGTLLGSAFRIYDFRDHMEVID